MPTYRSAWPRKDLLATALFGPMFAVLGGFMVVSRLQGVILPVSEKSHIGERSMALGEQYGIGAMLLAVGAGILVLLARNLFPHVDWDSPKVVAYGWRNQIVYSGAAADLDRISPLTREWGDKWFRIEG